MPYSLVLFGVKAAFFRRLAKQTQLNMSNSELACVYAALILADDGVTVTGDKISTILKAAKVDVEPYWPGLFAKALEGVDIKDLITNIGSGVGAAPAGGAAPAAEEKKEEKKEDDMG